ncbi:MAG: hypothetical protein ACE3L7_14575 [Candidatus Pristimantibacillus sp.]
MYWLPIGMILTILLLVSSIILLSLLVTTTAVMMGRYLNRYFLVSYKGSGTYELHCNPIFGFYYAKPEKYFALQEEALRVFLAGYPGATLYMVTTTLQRYYCRQGMVGRPMIESRIRGWRTLIFTYSLIFRNLANYRKRNEWEWQFTHLLKRVNRSIPRRYILLKYADSSK